MHYSVSHLDLRFSSDVRCVDGLLAIILGEYVLEQ
jgi:hypothetical protein